MKGEIKKKYQEFVNHIDFPAIIYIYENNRILAINSYARSLVGEIGEDIRTLFEGKKLKFPKDLVRGGSKLLLNIEVLNDKNEKFNIDVDVNIFRVDNVHFVLMLFENSYKNCFIGQLSVQTPRVAWQYAGDRAIGMNTALKNDIETISVDDATELSFLDSEIEKKIREIGKRITDTGESQFNSIQMITTSISNSRFIKVHRMPIVNSAGENTGVLSVHNKILNKEKHKALFDSAIKNSNMVNEIMDKGDTVFISWLSDEQATIQYISPNISRYGYSQEDFASGKITFKNLIFQEDYSIISCKFKVAKAQEETETKTSVYEYRMKKASGEIIWVHEECTPVALGNNNIYNFSSIQDITSRKLLESELNERKKEYQLKKEHISMSDKVDFRMFRLEELFDFDDIKGVQKLLSEVMYLVSFITDKKGEIISEPISVITINDDIKKIISSKRSIRIYKECGQKAYKSKEPCIYEFYTESIKVAAISFDMGGVHLGNLIAIAVVDSIDIKISNKNEKRYFDYLKIFNPQYEKSFKDFKGIIDFLWEHVQTLCRAECHNIELIREKNNLQNTAVKLEDSYQVLEAILDNVDSCIFVVTPTDYVIRFANKKIKRQYGEDIVGSDLFAFLIGYNIESRREVSEEYTDINTALVVAKNKEDNLTKAKLYDNINNKYVSAKIENVRWIDGLEALLITMNDITYAENDNTNDKHNVYLDFLTGLPNRLRFEMDARNGIMNAIENNKNGAVIMFDIDDFKHINYRFGHEYGERFLIEIANKIKNNSKLKDCTYRCRGVEFLILLDYSMEDEVDIITEEIIDYFRKPWKLMGEEFYCSLSMGITMFPRDGINPKEILKNADLAMYEAKKTNDSMKVYYKSESK